MNNSNQVTNLAALKIINGNNHIIIYDSHFNKNNRKNCGDGYVQAGLKCPSGHGLETTTSFVTDRFR